MVALPEVAAIGNACSCVHTPVNPRKTLQRKKRSFPPEWVPVKLNPFVADPSGRKYNDYLQRHKKFRKRGDTESLLLCRARISQPESNTVQQPCERLRWEQRRRQTSLPSWPSVILPSRLLSLPTSCSSAVTAWYFGALPTLSRNPGGNLPDLEIELGWTVRTLFQRDKLQMALYRNKDGNRFSACLLPFATLLVDLFKYATNQWVQTVAHDTRKRWS